MLIDSSNKLGIITRLSVLTLPITITISENSNTTVSRISNVCANSRCQELTELLRSSCARWARSPEPRSAKTSATPASHHSPVHPPTAQQCRSRSAGEDQAAS